MSDSTPGPIILLLHDGELGDIRQLLDEVGAVYMEWIGSEHNSYELTPWNLVIATSARMLSLDLGAIGGTPTRIAFLDKDSRTLRSSLRRVGVDYMIGRPVHPTALRLLIQHVLYRGPERRLSNRVSVGASVQIRHRLRRRSAVLADLSTNGCRLLSSHGTKLGSIVTVYFPHELGGGMPFSVRGRITRVDPTSGSNAESEATSIVFEKPSVEVEKQLAKAIEMHVEGPSMFGGAPPVLAVPTPQLPVEADDPRTFVEEIGPDRRSDARLAYGRRVVSLAEGRARVLIGSDISIGGMLVETGPQLQIGEQLRLALHVRAGQEPLVVSAHVERGDTRGFALIFRDLSPDARKRLDSMLDDLPCIDGGSTGESRLIISEIV